MPAICTRSCRRGATSHISVLALTRPSKSKRGPLECWQWLLKVIHPFYFAWLPSGTTVAGSGSLLVALLPLCHSCDSHPCTHARLHFQSDLRCSLVQWAVRWPNLAIQGKPALLASPAGYMGPLDRFRSHAYEVSTPTQALAYVHPLSYHVYTHGLQVGISSNLGVIGRY